MSATAKSRAPFRDRIIPWYFVMGFLVVLAVNVVFVRVAIQSNPGVVTENAYEKGLAYNDILAELKAEKALGWNATIRYEKGQLHVTIDDRQHQPLTGATVTASIDRPLQQGFNQTIELAPTDTTDYAAPVQFPLHGQWDITLSILWNQQHAHIRQRLMVP